jgi:hypothetical protein
VSREVLTKKWSDWIDYWAVDYNFADRKEIIKVIEDGEEKDVWTGDYIFDNEWQTFRTKKNRNLELVKSAPKELPKGDYKVAVKVVDIFGNDTTRVIRRKTIIIWHYTKIFQKTHTQYSIPEIRWFPADEDLREKGFEKLIPPLVAELRKQVKAWRDNNYKVLATSNALLTWWFKEDHTLYNQDGSSYNFRYYFSQREALETVVWLYEVAQVKDKYDLIRYNSTGSFEPSDVYRGLAPICHQNGYRGW